MTKNKTEKIEELSGVKKIISTILVINSSKLKPYIELFENEPENVFLRPLGTLTGFFKINDTGDESAYIVNFLTSVLKKEYYINHRRSIPESLDAALHKVNLALAEITKNGNIQWLGNMDSVVCILENNALHFSVCGKAKVLLLRNKMLTDISEGLASDDEEPNPLKTFVNVSSGNIELGDKIIITSNDLFDIFSVNEIKKGAIRFPQEKFVQFFKTAMVNELSSAGTIVIDVVEAEKKGAGAKKKQKINAFSGKTYEKSEPPKDDVEEITKEEHLKKDYTDEKTGHIYIQGDQADHEESGPSKIAWFVVSEKIGDFLFWLKGATVKALLFLKAQLLLLFSSAISKTKKTLRRKSKPQKKSSSGEDYKSETIKQESLSFGKKLSFFAKTNLGSPIKNILPSPPKISKSFVSLNYQQKLYALLIILAIIIAPIVFIKLKKQDSPPEEALVEESIAELEFVLEDKKVQEIENIQDLVSSQGIKSSVNLQGNKFLINDDKLLNWKSDSDTEEFDLPDSLKGAHIVSSMEDLNLLFLMKDNRLFSFSPVSREFSENTLSLPGGSEITAIENYLTYIYLLDSNNNQIYRYPRAEGGFGEKSDWLKEDISISSNSDLVIDENIYLSSDNKIMKFFQGNKENFELESLSVPLVITKIFTSIETEYLYVLDKENRRLIRYSKEGALLNQYFHKDLKDSIDFFVEESDNKVYFITSSNFKSFDL